MKVKSKPNRGLLHAFIVLMVALSMAVLPHMVLAEEGATKISVGSVSAAPGDTIDVPVTVEGNSGILGATIEVSYDEGLTLTAATNGDAFSALTMTKPGSLASPCKFTWDGVEISEGDIKDGQILVLTFAVSENAEPDSLLAVSVSAEDGAVIDGDLNTVAVTYTAGGVTISNYMPGDLDENKIVNSRDVIYARRHIVGGYTQTVHTCAADVNDDLLINSRDVILMRRYIAGGYGVELLKSRLHSTSHGGQPNPPEPTPNPQCSHELEAIAAKSPTCTEEGNIAYWHCTKCDKYFTDAQGTTEVTLEETKIEAAGHTPVIDPAVAPTHSAQGWTEGSHCLVCGEVLKKPEPIEPLDGEEYSITYDVSNGDPYLAKLNITNPNPTAYTEGDSFKLANLATNGYRFLGWYDGAGNDATKVTRIAADMAENLELYAHWEVVTYTVQYESDVILDTEQAKYTVSEGLVLPTPKVSNYSFIGWADEEGELYGKRIPVGTTGNLTLKANWTSERNKTYTYPNPSNPTVYEDDQNKVIAFAYEIGRIENVPLYTIKDFGYISGSGVTRTATETYSVSTDQSTAETIANAVARATTSSSNWTLSSGWSDTTTYSEEWLRQHEHEYTDLDKVFKSNTNTWNISNGSYGSTTTATSDSSIDGWKNEVKVNGSRDKTTTDSWKNSAELSAKLSGGTKIGADFAAAGIPINAEKTFGWEIGGKVAGEQSKTTVDKSKFGFEAGGMSEHTGNHSESTTDISGWNSSESYGGSSTISNERSHQETVSELLSQKTGYGRSYILSGGETAGHATSDTDSQTNSYTSATTYCTGTNETRTSTWTTADTKDGYHRWVVAGTAHVFGIVCYDINTSSFFVYTMSIMDDETKEFEDYSNVTANYNDNENGVISFEVPYEEVIHEVYDRVHASDGLKIDLETGTVVGYSGSDTFVTIPEYYNAGNGDVIKITGISSTAFAGNTDIVTVDLSDYITEIPDGAFEGCSNLTYVNGTGVTSIGTSAFAGCTSMQDCGVFSKVTYLGENVFEGANAAYINASNPQVASAAILSGAKRITLNLNFLEDNEDVLQGAILNVPSTVEYLEINGDNRTFNGLTINSEAGETVLNKIHVVGASPLPVKITSPKVTLNQSSISSPGIALALTANSTEVGLRGTTTISSTSPNAMLSRNIKLYETASDVVGKLVVTPGLLVCGSIDGMGYLQCDNVRTIDEATFNKMLTNFTVTFNAGEGTCDETSRDFTYGVAIGELPVPTRDYFTFDGWYLESTGELVIAETVLPAEDNLTLVAHWKENDASDWVKADELPEGAQVVNTKWTYDLSVYRQDVDSYTYFRYCSPYDGIWNQDSCWVNGQSCYHEITLPFPLGSQANRFADVGGRSGDICGPYGSCEHKREGQSFWWLKSVNYKTVLDHVESKEATTEPAGENISNITQWVQYRAK